MSRLQVGGLALVMSGPNTGKVVTLKKYYPIVRFDDGDFWEDAWLISSRELINIYYCSQSEVVITASELKPLGDKQTQDKLKEESESNKSLEAVGDH